MKKYKCVNTFTSSLGKLYYFGDIVESDEYEMLGWGQQEHFVTSTDHMPYIFAGGEHEPEEKKVEEEIKPLIIKENPKAGEMIEEGDNIIFK